MTTTPTERRLAITPGTWTIKEGASFGTCSKFNVESDHGKHGTVICERTMSTMGYHDDADLEYMANLELIADAGTSFNACGLTPSELLAELTKLRSERDELVGALGALLEGRKNDAYGTAWSEAREVFAKHKPE